MRPPRRRSSLTVSAAALAAAAALLAAPRPAHGAPGDPDLTFGGDGTGRVQSPGGANGAWGMAVQPDGRILLAGAENAGPDSVMCVWRFHPDGSPDTSFNNGTGRAVAAGAPAGTFGTTVLLRGDGRILLTGNGSAGLPVFFLASLLPDGQPDLSFGPGHDGLISVHSFGPVTSAATALLPDGKILTAGTGITPYRIIRLLPDGLPDLSFGGPFAGSSNLPNTPYGNTGCTALALTGGGKMLLARGDGYFGVSRLLPNGNVDTLFGAAGTAITPEMAARGSCRAIAALADGSVLAGGEYTQSAPADAGIALVKYLPNGTADPGFGEAATPGRILLSVAPLFMRLGAMVVQSDGRILAAGYAGSDIIIMRCTAAGLPDNTFGEAGRVRTVSGAEAIRAAALLPDEKLLVAGFIPGPTSADHLLARYHAQIPVQLTVEHPPGTALPAVPPMPVDFGPVTAGTRFIVLTLRNNGLNTLTNLQAVITGESIPGDYHTNPPAAATLAPAAETTVLLRLTPSAAPGLRTATLRLTAGNVNPSLPPRLIPLTGSRATPLQIWRVTWFGSPDNSGPGADDNDFDHDGLPNFLEYATRSHPHLYTHDPCQPAGGGQFTYTRPAAALTEFSYEAESAPSPAGPWSAAGLTSVVLTDDGTVQTVRVSVDEGNAAPRMFLRLRVTEQ